VVPVSGPSTEEPKLPQLPQHRPVGNVQVSIIPDGADRVRSTYWLSCTCGWMSPDLASPEDVDAAFAAHVDRATAKGGDPE